MRKIFLAFALLALFAACAPATTDDSTSAPAEDTTPAAVIEATPIPDVETIAPRMIFTIPDGAADSGITATILEVPTTTVDGVEIYRTDNYALIPYAGPEDIGLVVYVGSGRVTADLPNSTLTYPDGTTDRLFGGIEFQLQGLQEGRFTEPLPNLTSISSNSTLPLRFLPTSVVEGDASSNDISFGPPLTELIEPGDTAILELVLLYGPATEISRNETLRAEALRTETLQIAFTAE